MYKAISDTAEYGGMKQGKRIISGTVKLEMEKVVKEIQNKEFYKNWELETKKGYPELEKMRYEQAISFFEQTTKNLKPI